MLMVQAISLIPTSVFSFAQSDKGIPFLLLSTRERRIYSYGCAYGRVHKLPPRVTCVFLEMMESTLIKYHQHPKIEKIKIIRVHTYFDSVNII